MAKLDKLRPVKKGPLKKRRKLARVPTVHHLAPDGCVVVYTDGSCVGQGNTEANKRRRAGVGVYFGPGSVHNLAERLVGEQTNNRAELWAIRRALELVRDNQATFRSEYPLSVRIYTDSSYSRDALGIWRASWEKSNFRNNRILNRDIIEPLWTLLDEFICPVDIHWVKAHAGNRGNEAADRLANQGASKPLPSA